MTSNWRGLALAAAWAIAACAGTLTSAHASGYAVRDLGALDPGGMTLPYAINDQGWVTGVSYVGDQRQAFVWKPAVGMLSLGTLGPGHPESAGLDINNAGQVVGWSRPASSSYDTHGVVWTPGQPASGMGAVNVVAINDGGQMVGSHHVAADGTVSALPEGFRASALNNHGHVAGSMITEQGQHVFTLINGQLQELPSLADHFDWAYAEAMNDHGLVVGASAQGGDTHAVLWRNGALVDLGDFDGGGFMSRAYGVNNGGYIVGVGLADGPGLGAQRAALWTPDLEMLDLNDMLQPGSGWTLTSAMGINAHQQVIALGYNAVGEYRAVLLTPMPEPSAMAFLAAGALLGVWMRARRRGVLLR